MKKLISVLLFSALSANLMAQDCSAVMSETSAARELPFSSSVVMSIKSDKPLAQWSDGDIVRNIGNMLEAKISYDHAEALLIEPDQVFNNGHFQYRAVRTVGGSMSWNGFPPVSKGAKNRLLWTVSQVVLPDGSYQVNCMAARGLTPESNQDGAMVLDMVKQLTRAHLSSNPSLVKSICNM